ncbi:MAG: sodium-transporting two-sector ATPase [Candidatus Saccharimonadia bacterium]
MFDNQNFEKLVQHGNLTGEVVSANGFIVEVKGLYGVRLGAQVLFSNGDRGLVREAHGDRVTLFDLDSEEIEPGALVVLEQNLLQVPVGEGLIGRVVTPLGEPIDDKGSITFASTSGIFNPAPGIMARSTLKDQLATGVAFVDMMFPVVLGQRIAVLGDSKSGKSTFLTQLTQNQKGTSRIVIYVLIGKRKVEINNLINRLKDSGAIAYSIVVVANIFDSLTQSYIAPYAACAMGEYLWHNGYDVICIYDDLSSHAEAYRELSLLQEVDPGRDSYPGDMFYAHSSLLERAGKLKATGKTLTALPVIMTPNDDITAYLPTSIMSITDGQIIFDLKSFRQGIRPGVNAGLSVSRVGGQAQTVRQKRLSGNLFKKLAQFHSAEEFSHFGSSLSSEANVDLQLGRHIYEALKQTPEELFTLTEQQLVLETVIADGGKEPLDIPELKKSAISVGAEVKDEADFDRLVPELLKKHMKPIEAPILPPKVPESNKAGSNQGKEHAKS